VVSQDLSDCHHRKLDSDLWINGIQCVFSRPPDEFIMVLDCDLSGARSQIERMKKWVLGDYTLQVGTNTIKIRLDASIGVAQWQPGETAVQITERADTSMYEVKEPSRSS